MISYDLSKRGSTPRYLYLYSRIREDITSGRLHPDERMPSKRKFAGVLNCSVNTVMTAYDLLVSEGFLYAVEKKGYFVSRLHYVAPNPSKKPMAPPEPSEDSHWFMDFRASHASLQLFPASLWAKCMREAIGASDNTLMSTVSWKGMRVLREAIASELGNYRGMSRVSPEQIVVGAGTEYLYSRLMQILGTGLTFASADTGPSKFAQIAKNHGHHWRYFPIDEKNLRVDLISQAPVDVVQLTPANLFPYGTTMPIDRRIAFFEWANAAKDRWIIEDDYDAEFCFVPAGHRSMFSEDAQDKVIYLNTFSKTMVPSLRISYMVLPPALLKRYEDTVSFYACTVSSYEQYALALFINRGYYERHLFRLLKHYRKLRAAILEAISRNAVLSRIAEVADSGAGTHFLMTVRTDLPEAEIARRAEAQSLRFHFFHPLHQKPPAGCVQIIINFASIEADNVDAVFERLGSIF
jgi:GntR family transcriptional regulator/MocR family aminotransferase